MALVKRDVGLDDTQVQSLMHQLRHEGVGQMPDELHREQVRDELVRRLRGEVTADPTLRPQRRTGLLGRLEQAHTLTPQEGLDGSTLHAVEQLRGRANLAEHRLRQRLRVAASRSGESPEQTWERFGQLRAVAAGGRKARASQSERDALVGLPRDPATRQALAELEQADAGPVRPVITDWAQVPGSTWQQVGYDADSGRLEVVDRDGNRSAFRAVPAGTAAQLCDPATAEAARLQVLHSGAHRYADDADAVAAGVAVRCGQCGQFAGDPHTCPADGGTRLEGALGVLRAGDGTVLGRMTDPASVVDALREHETVRLQVLLRVPGRYSWVQSSAPDPLATADTGAGTIRGDLLVTADPDGTVRVHASRLGCDCAAHRRTGRCRHRAVAERLALAQLHGPGPAAGAVFERDSAPAVAPLPPDNSTLRFADDPDAFAGVVRQALMDAGDDSAGPVPLILDEPALYGYGAGRRFGVEVEYVVDEARVVPYGEAPGDRDLALTTVTQEDYVWGEVQEQEWDPDKGAYVTRSRQGWVEEETEVPSADGEEPLDDYQLASARIGRVLYDQDLLDEPEQQQYGAAREQGYSGRTWSLEQDVTVSGEIVSPILSGSREDWQQLRQVCAVVREHGGSERRASAHVHMSAPEFAGDPRCLTRLLRLVAEYDDDLHRMAHTPGSHRNVATWAAPNPPPPELGFLDVSEAHRTHGHHSAVNTDSVGRLEDHPDSHHLEFRLFDASLQPGRMQAQIKLAAALTDYAVRHRDQPAGPRRPVGRMLEQASEHARPELELASPDDVDERTWAQQTAPVRALIDRLFRRDVDKRQIAALWAAGRYRSAP